MNDEIERRNAERTPKEGRTAPRKTAAASGKRGKKIANGLVVASAAAVLAVYAAGYTATQSAAAQLAAQASTTVAQTAIAQSTTEASVLRATPTTISSAAPTSVPAATAMSILGVTSSSASSTAALEATGAARTSASSTTTTKVTSTTTSAASAATRAAGYSDGTYTGSGTSRHGSIWATVVIQNGRIVSARITNSTTRYPTSRIASLPSEVVAQQSTDVNYVSGATDSSMAYLDAVASALTQAA